MTETFGTPCWPVDLERLSSSYETTHVDSGFDAIRSVHRVKQLLIPKSRRAGRHRVEHGVRQRLGGWRPLTLSLFLFGVVFLPSATAQVKEIRRVLIFNDFGSISSPGIASMDQAILTGLEKSPYQIELYNENLEITLFPDDISQRQIREGYIRKYSDRKPDVIIAVGPASLKFMVEMHEGSLRNTPIVFCGVPEGIVDQSNLDARFTGVWARIQPEKTLSVAVHLQPNTKHVVVVGGVGNLDRQVETIVRERFHTYESKFDFTYLTDLTMPALLERLKHLPSNTIVYYTAVTQDAAGSRFIDATQAVPMVASAANAPVFTVDDVDVGTGAVGGDVLGWAATGRDAAGFAVRVLNGKKPEDIPIVESDNIYLFDWKALQRWGFKESDLPPGSIVLNRQMSFWETYKRYTIVGIFLFWAQLLVIVGLLWQRANRRKTQDTLVRSHRQLLETEQRFRLVANSAPVMIWMSGVDKLCTYFNQRWLEFTGRSFEEELGNGWTKGVHPEDLKATLARYTNAFDRHEPFQLEYRLRRHDGEYRGLLDEGVPRFNVDGSFAGYIGSAIDITERKLAEETLSKVSQRLIEAQEEERAWLARELHDDINQNVALLAANLGSLREGLPPWAAEFSQQIADATEKLANLGNDIQNLSHHLHSPKLEYLGLAAAAASFCKEFSGRQHVDINFHTENIPEELPHELSLCLFRVLQEALQNAAKHSGSRHFEVSFRGGASEIELKVHDSGIGFEPEQALKGRGLGLTSMKERMKLVGGQLHIVSKPGAGTTIRACVPVRSEHHSMSAAG
jgi:PAS domain S-box-containing protein